MAKRIGITGGIGAGKSIVSKILETMDFPVFNSDDYAKSLLDSDHEVKAKLVQLAGSDIIHEGKIDRKKLAALIFKDDKLRQEVNAVIHPEVREAYASLVETSTSKCVFNEAAILFETGAYQQFDATILVTAPEELRTKRVIQRDHVTSEEVKARMKAQWSDQEKQKLATYVIINDEVQPLIAQLEKILEKLTS